MDKYQFYSLPIPSTVAWHERTGRQFNLHKTNAANEELVISLSNGREVQDWKPIYRLLHHYNSLSNKMDNSLLAVRGINHKYIVVEL